MRAAARAAFVALLLAPAARALAGDPREEREAAWRRFPVFVWFHGGPPRARAAFDALRAAGLLGCNVEGNDASDAEAAADVPFYVDHAAGKGDLFLRPADFERDEKALAKDPAGFRPRRPNCFVAPDVAARLDRRVDEALQHHAARRPLGWVLDDELSVTRGVNPMDYCYGPECLDGLRRELLAREGSLARINSAWGTSFTALEAVVPPTTEQARAANAERRLDRLDFVAWSDARAFMEEALAARLAELAQRVRAGDAGAPVGFTGGELPSAFGGFDWGRLLESQTLVEAYEAGAAPELVHGLKRPGTKVLTTWFVPDEAAARAAFDPWEEFRRAARGDDGAVIWSSGAIFDGDGALNEAGRRIADVVAAARRLREVIPPDAVGAPDVVLLVSQPSIRAAWMVDSWGDGRTWPRRLTSWEADHSSSGAARAGWEAVCGALGLRAGYVDVRRWRAGTDAIPAGARIVVLPVACALDDADVERLLQFARGGGLVVADALPLLFDARLRGRDDGALRRLFGVRREPGRRLADLAALLADAKVLGGGALGAEGAALAAEAAKPAAPFGFAQSVGRGSTWLLDRRLDGIAASPARLSEFCAAFDAELARRGLSPARPHLAPSAAGVARLYRRTLGETEFLVVLRCGGRGATSVRLELPRASRVRERLGRPLAAILEGPAEAFELRLDLDHPLLLECSPAR